MGWIVFEALAALAVMLGLVWWTFRSRREPERPPEAGREPPAEPPA